MKDYINISLLVVLVGCQSGTEKETITAEVNQATIGKHIERLASDEFSWENAIYRGRSQNG